MQIRRKATGACAFDKVRARDQIYDRYAQERLRVLIGFYY